MLVELVLEEGVVEEGALVDVATGSSSVNASSDADGVTRSGCDAGAAINPNVASTTHDIPIASRLRIARELPGFSRFSHRFIPVVIGYPEHLPERQFFYAGEMADNRPIGMFDSGFGGLTVARATIDLLPDEQLIYVGDTGRYPYGPRSLDEVRKFSEEITRFLIEEHDVKSVVIACNTASAAALTHLQETFDRPVIGVIEAGVASLLVASESGRVGVIGTVGTIGSGAYQHAIVDEAAKQRSDVVLTCAACPGFVEFVERGELRTDQVRVLAERLLAPVVDADVDALLLGCTHYPFLARVISEVMGRGVVLVSSADETAFALRRTLHGTDSAASPRTPGEPRNHRFLSSGDVAWFEELGRQLLGPELLKAEPCDWT